MSKLVAYVSGISLADPYDTIMITGLVQLESTAGSYPWTAYPLAGSTQTAIKAACIAAAETVAAGHSLTAASTTLVGWSDEAAPDDDSGLCNVPGASSTVSLAASTPRRPSTTRPVAVLMIGSWSWNLTAIGTATGSLSFQSDSSATPSTAIYAPAWSRGIGVGVVLADTGTMPVCLSYTVPPGHYYQVVAAGGATFSLREQVL